MLTSGIPRLRINSIQTKDNVLVEKLKVIPGNGDGKRKQDQMLKKKKKKKKIRDLKGNF